MRLIFFLLLGLVTYSARSYAGFRDIRFCMTEHMREALEINKTRKPLYEKLSSGQSAEVSNRLMQMERRLLWMTPFADLWAAPYQAVGVPIVCDDLISMSKTPEFSPAFPQDVSNAPKENNVEIGGMIKHLLNLYDQKNLQGLVAATNEEILKLEKTPRYNCLVRHMLESIRRSAALAPRHADKAKQAGWPSTELLSMVLLKSTIELLEESAEIDAIADPLHARGLPILCRDIPYIPMPD